MKKRKFLLLMLGLYMAAPAMAGDTGQLPLSKTNLRGAHCDGAEKSDSALMLDEIGQTGKEKKEGAATTAKD